MQPLNNAALFLVKIIFEFYIMLLMLRFLLTYFGANYYNPMSQFVSKLTRPVVKPLQQFMPNLKGFDSAVLLLIFVFEVFKLLLISLLHAGTFPDVGGLIIWSIAECLDQYISLYFFMIIGRVILSYIQAPNLSPIQEILYLITEPLLAPARRHLPLIGGFDLSPIVAIILLQLTAIILVAPLSKIGLTAAFT